MRYLLGIDGGGTQTRAVLVDEAGCLLGQSVGGPSNFHSVGLGMAVQNIKECVLQALADAFPTKMVDELHLALGLAGVGRPRDHAEMLLMLHRELGALASELTLMTDAHIALRGALKGKDGIVVIAGTGAIALGAKKDRVERAGGWGYLLDDRGSGYDLGRQAVTAALRAFDGRGPETVLGQLICEHVGIKLITDIITPIYQGDLDRTAIADFVPLLIVGAEAGDNVSREILREGGRELGCTARAVARRLELDGQFAVAGVGGVLSRKLPYLYPAFVEEIARDFPEAEIVEAAFEPVYGALILAAEQAGVATEPMIRRWEDEAQSSEAR